MQLGMIYARARNGVIGKDGVMPWRLPEDMAHFKATTMGWPVIMGRKTWDSIPPKFRPFVGRRNIVITRRQDWHAEGVERVSSLEEALALCAGSERAWIVGGGEIYKQSLPCADVVVATEIEADFEGDTFAPQLGDEWHETARERHVAATGLAYSFVTYNKR